MVVEGEGPNKGKLAGIITLSDVLRYIILGRDPTPSGIDRMTLSTSAPMSPATSNPITPGTVTPLTPAVEGSSETLS